MKTVSPNSVRRLQLKMCKKLQCCRAELGITKYFSHRLSPSDMHTQGYERVFIKPLQGCSCYFLLPSRRSIVNLPPPLIVNDPAPAPKLMMNVLLTVRSLYADPRWNVMVALYVPLIVPLTA